MTATEETPREKLDRLRSRLSVEQRIFCEEFANCGDACAAYTVAFGKENPRAAKRLIGREMIEQYLATMLECTPADVMYTRGELAAHLIEIANDTKARTSDRIRAIEVAAKLAGLGVTTKHEVTGKDGEPLPTSNGLTVDGVNRVRAFILGVEPESDNS